MPAPARETFETDALAVMGDLRALLSSIIEAKCGAGPAVTDISSALGIHYTVGGTDRGKDGAKPSIPKRRRPIVECILGSSPTRGGKGPTIVTR